MNEFEIHLFRKTERERERERERESACVFSQIIHHYRDICIS